jgi:hypothetical protein
MREIPGLNAIGDIAFFGGKTCSRATVTQFHVRVMERCVGGPKNKTFGAHFSKDIILCENDEIINIQTNVPETFNNVNK